MVGQNRGFQFWFLHSSFHTTSSSYKVGLVRNCRILQMLGFPKLMNHFEEKEALERRQAGSFVRNEL